VTLSVSQTERATLQPVFDYIDAHAAEFAERLRTLCRQPSISAQNRPVETAALVEALAQAIGAEPTHRARRRSIDRLRVLPGDGSRTIQLYDHYDVQPPELLDLWRHEPFAADIADGTSGHAASRTRATWPQLCAIEAYQAVLGRLRCASRWCSKRGGGR
jgi:acetylornithine deacetylase/succinyl-diaminopimelate desuccinylase-like protein